MNFRNMNDALFSLNHEAHQRFQECAAAERSSSDDVQASIERRKKEKWRAVSIALSDAMEASEHGMELACL